MKVNGNTMLAAILLLCVTACRDKDTRLVTTINDDGTCCREYIFHSSPGGLMTPPEDSLKEQLLWVGPEWERTWTVEGDTTHHPVPITEEEYYSYMDRAKAAGKQPSDIIMLHVRRKFDSVEEMSKTFYHWDQVVATSELEKKFKWFYTDYTFTETFKNNRSDILRLPITDFMAADTASYWCTGQPDLSQDYNGAELKEMLDGIEVKVSQWLNANLMDRVCSSIASSYDEIPYPPMSKEQFEERCQTLVRLPRVINHSYLDDENGEGIKQDIDAYFHTDAFTTFPSYQRLVDHCIQDYTRGYNFFITSLFMNYDLVMPGTIIDAGIGRTVNDTVHYRLTSERLLPHEYAITATSRKVNIWAFIVTALVILLAIGSFVYRRR
ncbi:MAG: hypothetical protein IJ588_06570 [Prevotella sp.]|nr:hypothetical protein [Prevotella sp.]